MSTYYIPIVDTGGPNLLTLKVVGVLTGHTSASLPITSSEAGTLTALSAGGLTNVTYEVDSGSGPVTVTLPFSVSDGDTIIVSFDAAVSDTSFSLTGTY